MKTKIPTARRPAHGLRWYGRDELRRGTTLLRSERSLTLANGLL